MRIIRRIHSPPPPSSLRTPYSWPLRPSLTRRASSRLPCPSASLISLQVPEAEVESWVVRAIARGLLDARMDQMARTVSVTRSLQRAFGSAQWSSLQAKLRAWRENVSSLLTTVESKA